MFALRFFNPKTYTQHLVNPQPQAFNTMARAADSGPWRKKAGYQVQDEGMEFAMRITGLQGIGFKVLRV